MYKLNNRTIESILDYKLTNEVKTHLKDAGIINGIGGKGNNIENAILANIELLPGYDHEKAERLLSDIRELSIEHDVRYYFQTGFYSANFRFAKGIFHLLHWAGVKRFATAVIIFIILNRLGNKYYYR